MELKTLLAKTVCKGKKKCGNCGRLSNNNDCPLHIYRSEEDSADECKIFQLSIVTKEIEW